VLSFEAMTRARSLLILLLLAGACSDDAPGADAAAIDAAVIDAAPGVDAPWVDDGTPTRLPCTETFGSALTTAHGRLDGYLVSIVEPGSGGCTADSGHMKLQILVGGAVYDVAVAVESDYGDPDMLIAAWQGMMTSGAWSEGWHPGYNLDYVTLGMHSGDFVATAKAALVARLEADLADVNHISIYGTGYGPDGVHLIHREGGGHDGALVLRPLSGAPYFLLFHFADQTF
jgi:hypothetical protein